jgi:ankyrin repeat domain-containing protein 50
MRKRDFLLPKALRPNPVISNTLGASSSAVQLMTPSITPSASSIQSLQGTSTTAAIAGNEALALAIQRHLDTITGAEKEAFREARKTINEDNLLLKARECDNAHQQRSLFRPQAERLARFLKLLDRFMGGIAIGIQAYPEISSLVVGAVRIVIDLAIDFMDFFSKLADMLCQFEDYLQPLADVAKASQDSMLVQKTAANIYGDLLEFCQKARRVFVDTNGNPRKWTSWRLFMRQQWEPFETGFGSIKKNMQHHLDVLRLAGQALQLHNDRDATQERRRKSS